MKKVDESPTIIENYKVDVSKIETLEDVKLILHAMDLHVPSHNENIESIRHLITPVE